MVFNLLKKHFLQNKAVFGVFILCQIFSLLVAIFIFNFLNTKATLEEYNESNFRTVSMVLDTDDKADLSENIQKLLNDKDFMNHIDTIEADALYNNYHIRVLLYLKNEQLEIIESGRNVTTDEVKEQRAVMVTNPRIEIDGESPAVGKNISIFGKEYEIVGIFLDNNYIQIPYSKELSAEIRSIRFVHDIKTGSEDYSNTIATLNSAFPNSTTVKAEDPPEESFEITAEDILIALTLIIININFATLYFYILERDKRTFAILKMCGCTPKRGAFILLGELAVICLSSFVISILLFSFIGQAIFSYMHASLIYTFSLEATLRTLIVYLISVAVIFVPMLWKYNKSSVYELYRKEDNA